MHKQTMRPDSPLYVSEFEHFMNGFLAAHPDVEEDQRRGWYIWWDHHVDPNDIDKLRKEELPFKPYD